MNTIKMTPTYSVTGLVTLTKTTLNAITAMAPSRKVFSAEDVAFVINSNLHSDEQVEVKKVAKVLQTFAAEMAKGYRYNGLRGKLISQGSDFYEYK